MSALLVLVLHAAAFAPGPGAITGSEPVRVYRTHAVEQLRLAHQPGWAEFVAGEGRGWRARFDQRTGTARRAWGPGLDLGPVANAAQAEAAVRGLLRRNPGLAEVPEAQLRLESANYHAHSDTWFVDFDRLIDGVPVWRGGLTARFRFGKLVMLGVDTYPDAQAPQAEISAAEAVEIAELEGPAPMAPHQLLGSREVMLPLDVPGGVAMHRAYEVRTRTEAPLGVWVSFVDAATGELLAFYNDIRFLDGTVYGTHPSRTLDGNYSTSPMPYIEVEGESTAYADADGNFSVSGNSAEMGLSGSYMEVFNESGAEGSMSFSSSSPTWTTEDATLGEISAYVFAHQVRQWALDYAPPVRGATNSLTAYVNITDSNCNAYWDGNVNFYAAGGGCNNTAQISDVVHHEWGHGFHYYSIESGDYDGSLGEGAADSVAFFLSSDSTIAPYFASNGSGIREVETNWSYPDDVTGQVHQDGLIFGGAVWDLWEELLSTYGGTRSDRGEAYLVLTSLFSNALVGGPGIDTSYDEFVAADDDDGDLSNGSPNYCDIAEAFALHGLGPLADASGGLLVDHFPLENQPAAGSFRVTGSIVNLAAACAPFELDSVDLVYSTDGGESWDRVPGSASGEDFEANFPEIPAGTVVHYYVEASGSDGNQAFAPAGGKIAPYSFFVGELVEVWCDDLSDANDAYTHELLDGTDREGADDWMYDNPGGLEGDPDDAYTGRRVWGNDLGGGDYNGAYQPSIFNRLNSPEIPTEGATELIVQYRRWLNVEDSVYDRASVTANGDVIWTNHGSSANEGDEQTEDGEWKLATHRVQAPGDLLTIGWEIESDQGLEFGGWNIDDICVYRPADTALDLSPSAVIATDDQVGSVRVTWTQPAASVATEAIIVRNTDRVAGDAADGTVVATLSGLEPGGFAEFDDSFVGTAWYTVFSGSGDTWTASGVEGVNADLGTGLDEDGTGKVDAVDASPGGCGCDSGSAGMASLGVLGVLAGLARRQRR